MRVSNVLCILIAVACTVQAADWIHLSPAGEASAPLPPDVAPAARAYGFSAQSIANSRRNAYRQYEYFALLFGALGALEFVLRSTGDASVSRSRDIQRVVSGHGSLSTDAKRSVLAVYDRQQTNLRNRALHGVYFDIEARRTELVLSSGELAHLGVATLQLDSDESWSEYNAIFVANLVKEIADCANRTQIDTTWTSDFMLSASDLAFAQGLNPDLFSSEDSLSKWYHQIDTLLDVVCPSLKTSIKLGVTGWSEPQHSIDLFPRMLFLALLFEPCVRLTLQFIGQPILDRSVRETDDGKIYNFQYMMLDGAGLLSDANLNFLTSHLIRGEREHAKRAFRLATKTRDAIAHGALLRFTDDFRAAQGHLFVKSIQVLSSAALHHMTSM